VANHVEIVMERAKEDTLEERLRAHSAHFSSMVELIPAKFYISKDESESGAAEGAGDSKYWVNKRKKKTTNEVIQKAKRMKLDPSTQKSVAELQAEAVSQEELSVGGGQLNGFSVDQVQSLSLNGLQERLKEKIESFRNNRKVPQEGGLSEKAAARREKKVEKRKREKELRKKNLVKSGRTNEEKAKGAVKPSDEDMETKRVVFNKFDFSTPVETEMQVEKKKTGKKDYKRLLAKAEASQRKLDELKKNDERRGRELERKLQWQKALDMARGTKLKDDPKLLRKTSKKLDKRKHKSKKDWDERKKFEQEAQEKRQEKRKRNIQQRKDQVKERKIKKRTKKSGSRKPGF
jgi:hypothetical protein